LQKGNQRKKNERENKYKEERVYLLRDSGSTILEKRGGKNGGIPGIF